MLPLFLSVLNGDYNRGYLKVHGTYLPIIAVLITLLVIPLKGLIGVIPIISRVISPDIIG